MRLLRLHGGVWLLLDSCRTLASPPQLLVAVGKDTGETATTVGSHHMKLGFERRAGLGWDMLRESRSCL